MMGKTNWCYFPLAAGVLLSSMPLLAALLTVRATIVVAPSCMFNGGNPIEMDFGNDVMNIKVDGSYKKMTVPYRLTCLNLSKTGLKMYISGEGAGFDARVLATSMDNLGIAFISNNNLLPLTYSLDFALPDIPPLEVVLVKKKGSNLTTGPFSAAATMHVEYQ